MFNSQSTSPIKVLDVGLGLAYNAINTIDAWNSAINPPKLEITSLEIEIELVELLLNNAPWTENWPENHKEWLKKIKQIDDNCFEAVINHKNKNSLCIWRTYIEDASYFDFPKVQNPQLEGWNFIWQDPFSPQKNPKLWTKEWFSKLHASSNSNCILLTYSVARSVKESLEGSGWKWEKFSSPTSTKRHWLKAIPNMM